MSFTASDSSSPNYISCYFKFVKKIFKNNIIGDISGPYSLAEIISIDTTFNHSTHTIIQNVSNTTNTFIVGIPKKNNNNISKNNIYAAMSVYDINLLRSIKPYKKLRGNDTSIPTNLADCSGTQFLTNGNVEKLNKVQQKSIIDNLGIANRLCLRNTKYF